MKRIMNVLDFVINKSALASHIQLFCYLQKSKNASARLFVTWKGTCPDNNKPTILDVHLAYSLIVRLCMFCKSEPENGKRFEEDTLVHVDKHAHCIKADMNSGKKHL